MNFAEAWDTLSTGDRVVVSDGLPPPSVEDGMVFFAWRSHNFVGTLEEKIEGDYRCMRIEMDPDTHTHVMIAYTVCEAVEHTFTRET